MVEPAQSAGSELSLAEDVPSGRRKQYSLSSFDTDRLKLLWAKAKSHIHRKLSLNIIREISAYLWDVPILFLVLHSQLFSIDLSSQRSRTVHLRNIIDLACSVSINDGSILACSCASSTGPNRSAFVIDSKGGVSQVLNMTEAHWLAGIVYDHAKQSVLVFGGKAVVRTTSTSRLVGSCHCEKLLLPSLLWEQLPDMMQSRYQFNPCKCAGLVYLCGGSAPGVETYDTQSNVMNSLPFPNLLCGLNGCIALVRAEQLIVITETDIYSWHLKESRMTAVQQHKLLTCYSYSTPVVREDCVYIITRARTCISIHLKTGDVAEVKVSRDKKLP